jgi:hypothetical protein
MFTVGVLLIGSLVWDGKEHRRKWRTERLDFEYLIFVKVPIRYGRKS